MVMDEETRIAIIEEVERHLWKLRDHDELVRVALATGMTVQELFDLGGL